MTILRINIFISIFWFMVIKSKWNLDVPTDFWRFCRPHITIYKRNLRYGVKSVEIFPYILRRNRFIQSIKTKKI